MTMQRYDMKRPQVTAMVTYGHLGFPEGVEDELHLLRGEDAVVGHPAGATQVVAQGEGPFQVAGEATQCGAVAAPRVVHLGKLPFLISSNFHFSLFTFHFVDFSISYSSFGCKQLVVCQVIYFYQELENWRIFLNMQYAVL